MFALDECQVAWSEHHEVECLSSLRMYVLCTYVPREFTSKIAVGAILDRSVRSIQFSLGDTIPFQVGKAFIPGTSVCWSISGTSVYLCYLGSNV